MGTDNTARNLALLTIGNHEEFKNLYLHRVVSVQDLGSENARVEARAALSDAVLLYLYSAEPYQKMPPHCNDLFEENIIVRNLGNREWDPSEASTVCSQLEEMVLNLSDKPWRKDFHKIRWYSGFWTSLVERHVHGMSKLLALVGYNPDHNQAAFVLSAPPKLKEINSLAADLYLISKECLIYHEILTHVQSDGFDIRHIHRCRVNIRGNVKDCVKWIQTHCTPKSHVKCPQMIDRGQHLLTLPHTLHSAVSSEYTEIGAALYSSPTEDFGRDEKFSPVNSPAESRKNQQKLSPVSRQEPIYSQVKKSVRKELKDSGYISSPPSTELGVLGQGVSTLLSSSTNDHHKNSGCVKLKADRHNSALISDEIADEKSTSCDETVANYGFDSCFLDRSSDRFKPATTEEHHMKSFQFLSEIEDEAVVSSSGHAPGGGVLYNHALPHGESDWEFVRQDLLRRHGNQYILGERGDILNRDHSQSDATQTSDRAADSRSNITFSTFKAPVPQNQCNKRSGSPLQDVLISKGCQLHGDVGLDSQQSSFHHHHHHHHMCSIKTPWQHTAPKPVTLPTVPGISGPEVTPRVPSTDDWSSVTASAIQSNMDRVANYRSASFYENLPAVSKTHEHVAENARPTSPRVSYPPSDCNRFRETTARGRATKDDRWTTKSHTSPIISYPPKTDRLDSTDASRQVHHTAPMALGNHWQCSDCTSFNIQGTEICDICHKSRMRIVTGPSPSSDGPQCPRCTLINAPAAQTCSLCDFSFIDARSKAPENKT